MGEEENQPVCGSTYNIGTSDETVACIFEIWVGRVHGNCCFTKSVDTGGMGAGMVDMEPGKKCLGKN